MLNTLNETETEKLIQKGVKVTNEKGEAKMIGMVGTNRWSAQVCSPFSFP